MLKTQATDDFILARDKNDNGAIKMIGHALINLDSNDILKISREKKDNLFTNMLIIVCGQTQSNFYVGSSVTKFTEIFHKYH